MVEVPPSVGSVGLFLARDRLCSRVPLTEFADPAAFFTFLTVRIYTAHFMRSEHAKSV